MNNLASYHEFGLLFHWGLNIRDSSWFSSHYVPIAEWYLLFLSLLLLVVVVLCCPGAGCHRASDILIARLHMLCRILINYIELN